MDTSSQKRQKGRPWIDAEIEDLGFFFFFFGMVIEDLIFVMAQAYLQQWENPKMAARVPTSFDGRIGPKQSNSKYKTMFQGLFYYYSK